MSHAEIHDEKLSTHIAIWLALLGLAAATTCLAFVNLGIGNVIIALIIAFTQTALIFTFSMHLKGSAGFIKLLIIAAFIFVAVMFGMTYNDFASRQFASSKLDSNTWIARSPHQYSDETAAAPPSAEHHG